MTQLGLTGAIEIGQYPSKKICCKDEQYRYGVTETFASLESSTVLLSTAMSMHASNSAVMTTVVKASAFGLDTLRSSGHLLMFSSVACPVSEQISGFTTVKLLCKQHRPISQLHAVTLLHGMCAVQQSQ